MSTVTLQTLARVIRDARIEGHKLMSSRVKEMELAKQRLEEKRADYLAQRVADIKQNFVQMVTDAVRGKVLEGRTDELNISILDIPAFAVSKELYTRERHSQEKVKAHHNEFYSRTGSYIQLSSLNEDVLFNDSTLQELVDFIRVQGLEARVFLSHEYNSRALRNYNPGPEELNEGFDPHDYSDDYSGHISVIIPADLVKEAIASA